MQVNYVLLQTKRLYSLPWLFIILPWSTEESQPLCQISSIQDLISLIYVAHQSSIRESKIQNNEEVKSWSMYYLETLREKGNSELLSSVQLLPCHLSLYCVSSFLRQNHSHCCVVPTKGMARIKKTTNKCSVLLPDLAQVLSAGFTHPLPLGVP